MRALIIEDDNDIAACVKSALEAEYFAVDIARDGDRGSELGRVHQYDLIILDINLPGRDGLEVCQDIRKAQKSCFILVLSGVVDTDKKVALLDAGADDYLTKPFSLTELVARIKALMRRLPTLTSDTLSAGDLVLDTRSHIAQYRQQQLPLTRKEFALLEYLIRNKGAALTRAMIMEHVWDMNADPFSNTIEAHVLGLRKKLKSAGAKDLIATVPGIGYRLQIE